MRIIIVEARIKPGMRERFIDVIKGDASHSERDEPGCLRFDVLQDSEDADRFFFYEVYRDDAAVASHRQTPHFQRFFEQVPQLLEGSMTRHVVTNVHPQDEAWR